MNTSAGEVSTADAGIFGLGARCVDELVDDGVGAAITVGVSVLPLVLPFVFPFVFPLVLPLVLPLLEGRCVGEVVAVRVGVADGVGVADELGVDDVADGSIGVIELDGELASDVPIALVAVTVNV